MPFSITTQSDTLLTLAFSGEVDLFDVRDLKEEINALVENANAPVIVDLTQADYLDSSALGLLVGIRKRVLANNHALHLAVAPTIAKLIELSDLDQLFTLHGTLKEAENALEAQP